MVTKVKDVLDRLYAAFDAGDGAALERLFDEDAVMIVPGSTQISGTYTGRREILGAFARMAELTGGTSRAEVRRVTTDDAGAVVIAVDHAVRFGEPVTAEFADVFTIVDGVVRELRFYPADPEAMAHFWRE